MRPVLPFTLGLEGVVSVRLNSQQAEFTRRENAIALEGY
jgi:hypothetical protein